MGIGDWGLAGSDYGFCPNPLPQNPNSPIPNPQANQIFFNILI